MDFKKKYAGLGFRLKGVKVGLDVDGTLTAGLNHDVENNFGDIVDMLNFLYRNGVDEVFLVTGRPPWSVREWIENTFEGRNSDTDLDTKKRFYDTEHVFFDGALIADLRGNITFQKPISEYAVSNLCELLAKIDVDYGMDTYGGYYVKEGYSMGYFPAEEYYDISDIGKEHVYAGYMVGFESIDRVEEVNEKIRNEIDGVACHYFYSFEGNHCVVISPKGVDKMSGIKRRMKGESDYEKLIFFGDGSNDIPVFKEALLDENIIALPSRHARDSAIILELSKWNRLEIDVPEFLMSLG